MYERLFYCVKGFFEIKKKKKFWNVFCSCMFYNIIDEMDVFFNEFIFKKVSLVIVNKVWKYMFELVSNCFGCYFIIVV